MERKDYADWVNMCTELQAVGSMPRGSHKSWLLAKDYKR